MQLCPSRKWFSRPDQHFRTPDLAAISGALLLIALVAFLINIVMTLGLKGAVGIFTKSERPVQELVPPPA